jgi:hypothetical protein
MKLIYSTQKGLRVKSGKVKWKDDSGKIRKSRAWVWVQCHNY